MHQDEKRLECLGILAAKLGFALYGLPLYAECCRMRLDDLPRAQIIHAVTRSVILRCAPPGKQVTETAAMEKLVAMLANKLARQIREEIGLVWQARNYNLGSARLSNLLIKEADKLK